MPNATPQETNLVVAKEVALADFDRLCRARRLKTVDEKWTEEEQKAFDSLRDDICAAICEGRLEIDNDDDPVLKPTGAEASVPSRIKFKKPKGSTLLAMDAKPSNGARQFAAYADMSGIGASHFSNLQFWDVELLARLFVLFFASR